MNSKLYKWMDGEWIIDPPDGVAYSGQIIYALGDECIEASAGEDACRIILFFDHVKKKAALLHTNDMNGVEYIQLVNALKTKKFNTETTKVFLCGDEGDDGYRQWNDSIEEFIKNLGYDVTRVIKGKEKEVCVNPGRNELTITDRHGRNLLEF